MKTPDLLLEQMRSGEKPAAGANSADLEKLIQSDTEILSRYPANSQKEAVARKLALRAGRSHTSFFRMAGPLSAIAAALILALTVLPLSQRNSALQNTPDSIRMKGSGLSLQVFKKTGTQAELLTSNDQVRQDDVLQIRYRSDSDQWGVILSVDGNGNVFQHYPENGNLSAQLTVGEELALNYSYRLDNAPHFERFIFISSARQFPIENIRQTLSLSARADSSGGFRLNGMLPAALHSTDILLIKQEPSK